MGFLCGFIFGIIFTLVMQSQLRRLEQLEIEKEREKSSIPLSKYELKKYE